ncbi:MAG: hypothetical protein EPN21_03250 [Methylococcaceae bacterium]|nr:MAG: hypothetical protein EPN21_03250 [Methylococcaceae bacterium]
MSKIFAEILIHLALVMSCAAAYARQYSEAENEIRLWGLDSPKYEYFFFERDVVLYGVDLTGDSEGLFVQLDKKMASYSSEKERKYIEEADAAGLKQYMRPFRYIGRIKNISEIAGKSATILIVYLSNATTAKHGNIICATVEKKSNLNARARVLWMISCATKNSSNHLAYKELIEELLWSFPTDSATTKSSAP